MSDDWGEADLMREQLVGERPDPRTPQGDHADLGLSALAWLLSLIFHTEVGLPTVAVLWIVNIVMTIIFGLGHLPALKRTVGEISRIMFARSLILNAPIGLLCGWLFWTYGIEAALMAHFSADIIYHVVGTVVLRRKLSDTIET
jgi:hypothetical protein